jgi:hypothetical protein
MSCRIMIYGGGRPPKVVPGRKEVYPGDRVSFEARGTAAKVIFPPPPKWPFVEPWQVIDVDQEQVKAPERSTFTVKEIVDALDLEEFPYAVYCSSPNCFAVGESDPIIIIRRP